MRAATLNDFGSLTVENRDDLPHRLAICHLSADGGGHDRSPLAFVSSRLQLMGKIGEVLEQVDVLLDSLLLKIRGMIVEKCLSGRRLRNFDPSASARRL